MNVISTALKTLISAILAIASLLMPSVTESATEAVEPLNAKNVSFIFRQLLTSI